MICGGSKTPIDTAHTTYFAVQPNGRLKKNHQAKNVRLYIFRDGGSNLSTLLLQKSFAFVVDMRIFGRSYSFVNIFLCRSYSLARIVIRKHSITLVVLIPLTLRQNHRQRDYSHRFGKQKFPNVRMVCQYFGFSFIKSGFC